MDTVLCESSNLSNAHTHMHISKYIFINSFCVQCDTIHVLPQMLAASKFLLERNNWTDGGESFRRLNSSFFANNESVGRKRAKSKFPRVTLSPAGSHTTRAIRRRIDTVAPLRQLWVLQNPRRRNRNG